MKRILLVIQILLLVVVTTQCKKLNSCYSSIDRSKTGYELAGAYDNCTICNAQKTMTHIECKDIDIRATRLPVLEFYGSYATLNAEENWIQPFYTISAENMSAYTDAPASINGVISAKLKAKDSVDAAFGFRNPLPQGICEDVQQDIYQTVLYEVLTAAQRAKYRLHGKQLRFIRDDDPNRDLLPIDKIDNSTNPVDRGALWEDIDPATKIFKSADNSTYYYEPWSLYVTLDNPNVTDENLKGVRYCKLLSHQAILSWMLEKSFEENPVLITPAPTTVCDGPSALYSDTNGSCLLYFALAQGYYCMDFTGSGFTPENSQFKCDNSTNYRTPGFPDPVYSTLPCKDRAAEIAAYIPNSQGLTGVCVIHCNQSNEFIWNIYTATPEDNCTGFDFFTPAELGQ